MSNILSNNIKVYPTAFRGVYDNEGTKVIWDPTSLLGTEPNLTRTLKVLARYNENGFVITESYSATNSFDFIIGGYYFSILKPAEVFTVTVGTATPYYAHILLTTITTAQGTSIDNQKIVVDQLSPVNGQESTTLDESEKEDSKFYGILIDNNASDNAKYTYNLHLLDIDTEGNITIPENSLIKFREKDIDGGEGLNISQSFLTRVIKAFSGESITIQNNNDTDSSYITIKDDGSEEEKIFTNKKEEIGGSKEEIVKGDFTGTFNSNKTETIEKDFTETIKGNKTESVKNKIETVVNYTLKASEKISNSSKDTITNQVEDDNGNYYTKCVLDKEAVRIYLTDDGYCGIIDKYNKEIIKVNSDSDEQEINIHYDIIFDGDGSNSNINKVYKITCVECIEPTTNNSGSLGTTDSYWNVSYITNIYSSAIDTSTVNATTSITAPAVNTDAVNISSDLRLKENIKSYKRDKSILDLDVKEFDYKKTKEHTIGCIAQDLQEICPEIVKEDENGYLSIQETKLVYLLLNEVKALKAEIEELKKSK